ncbi:hypothetical protein GCM10022225_60890 [Plantactinospora mayteni]|uniref:Histidine kinase n=1 Tax=Plantactinospora mayteni TaxID=566021 RepID=A0ABQ4EZT1_9ACTN|nr:hypothetical protein [Plantactinospora mayteni]GIH00169.1 hypothetical protein Pma05_67410 [Plantactinospora mayteni]
MPTDLAGGAAGTVTATVERGPRIAAVLIAFGWHLVINLPAVLGNWPQYRLPWVVGAGWLVFSAVGLVAAVNLLRGAPSPTWPLVGVLLLVDVLVFACTPASLVFDSANFGWATLGWFVVLLLWGRRIPALVAVLAVGAAIALVGILALRGAGAADLSRYAMAVYGNATLPIAMMIAVNLLGTLAGSTARAAAARTAIETERAAAGRMHQSRRDRLAALDRTAGAILTELAEGRADPADPAVQRRCALEASRLRRLIAESDDVPDPLLHELRACVDVVERNGLPVDFVAVGTLPPLPVEIRRQLAEPLTTTLTAATRWARLTVVGQPDEVVVSLTTPGTSTTTAEPGGTGDTIGRAGDDFSAVAGEVEYVYEENEELVWVQTRWRAA